MDGIVIIDLYETRSVSEVKDTVYKRTGMLANPPNCLVVEAAFINGVVYWRENTEDFFCATEKDSVSYGKESVVCECGNNSFSIFYEPFAGSFSLVGQCSICGKRAVI